MRIHLGHHFYGAGNLGDDFMLAGFLAAMQSIATDATFTACVPFALEPLRQRFPQITWEPTTDEARAHCIQQADVWLGLGGSPFQSAQSRWFIDHLIGDQRLCRHHGKRMFFLGVGVQTTAEIEQPEVQAFCANVTAIWTRDLASARRLSDLVPQVRIAAAADLAHPFFAQAPVPAAVPGRVTIVANFDYGTWPGLDACLQATAQLHPTERVWLAQESRELPGAERALFAALPATEQVIWKLAVPDQPGAPLAESLQQWPSGQWLVTSRYHAALAGIWAGSKVVIIAINEKLRGAAAELGVPAVSPQATAADFCDAFASITPPLPMRLLAGQARQACADFVAAARA